MDKGYECPGPRSGFGRKELVVGVVVIGLLFLVFRTFFQPSEEDEISERFRELSEFLAGDPPQGILGAAEVVGGFREMFADPVVMDTKEAQLNGVFTPKELAGIYISSVRAGASLEVSFSSLQIEIVEDGRALASPSFDALVVRPSGKKQREKGRVRVELRKVDGVWLFAAFERFRSA